MRLKCYGKEDITQPVEIPEGKWKETLQEIIIGTINNEEHLGSNLKKQCIDYLKDLFKEDI